MVCIAATTVGLAMTQLLLPLSLRCKISPSKSECRTNALIDSSSRLHIWPLGRLVVYCVLNMPSWSCLRMAACSSRSPDMPQLPIQCTFKDQSKGHLPITPGRLGPFPSFLCMPFFEGFNRPLRSLVLHVSNGSSVVF